MGKFWFFSLIFFMFCTIGLCGCRMGYDLERFVGYVNEGLLCCVCRDVLERPLQAPCEHAYCSACISSWLVHHHSCPEDRLPLDVGSLKPLYRCVSHFSAAVCSYVFVFHNHFLHFTACFQWHHWLILHFSFLYVCLMTGTCEMTWTGCRSVVWMQGRDVKWSRPWRACTHTRMSVSLPSFPALTQVSHLTLNKKLPSFFQCVILLPPLIVIVKSNKAKVIWHLCVCGGRQVALLLSWLLHKRAHWWDSKLPKTSHIECNFSSFFHKHVSVYAQVCKCVYTNITSSARKLWSVIDRWRIHMLPLWYV